MRFRSGCAHIREGQSAFTVIGVLCGNLLPCRFRELTISLICFLIVLIVSLCELLPAQRGLSRVVGCVLFGVKHIECGLTRKINFPLSLIKLHAMPTYGTEVWLHPFLTFALDGDEWLVILTFWSVWIGGWVDVVSINNNSLCINSLSRSFRQNGLARLHSCVCVSPYSFSCYLATKNGLANSDGMVTSEDTPYN
jgi:hypothetical protein